jgi:hypothetical protein
MNIAAGQKANALNGNSFPGYGASSTSGVLDSEFDLQAFRTLQEKTSMCALDILKAVVCLLAKC